MKPAPLLLIAALLATFPLAAQSNTATNADDVVPQPGDPPARVARLNFISGDVSFQPAGMDAWTDATLNYPLTTSDHLVTGAASRAELHIGPNAIRLDANSNFGFLNLDDSTVQISLTEGSVEIRLRLFSDDDAFEIATPNGAITLLRTGDYRIDTDPGRDATMLTVRSGQAEIFSDNKSLLVRSRQTAWFRPGQPTDVRPANAPDDFDAFASARNDAEDNAPHNEYVPEAMVGAEDLNTTGTWQEYPDLGWAWAPPVGVDWSPYSNGRWAFVEPWGWTWIDDAPWGFAPFHYGRWAWLNGRWIWLPGPRQNQVVYSPALVVFVGGGASASVSWFPLGPRDPWLPAWRNGQNTANMPRYANRQAPGAIRTMSQVDFAAARRVRPVVIVSPSGQVLGSAPLIAPVRESVLAGTARQRPAVVNRPLVSRTPPPAAPASFESRQRELNQNQGRPTVFQPATRPVPQPGPQQSSVGVQAVPPVNAPNSGLRPQSNPRLGGSPAPQPQATAPVERRPAVQPVPQQTPRQQPQAAPLSQPAPAAKPAAPKPEPHKPAEKPKPAEPRPAIQDKPSQ